MQHKRLRATQVRLDPTNPRLPDGTTSDHEAINRLLDEGYTQMLALAKDFLAVGESNPSELPIVTKEGSKYLVLEGNRRFAVLKLLANPTLAEDASRRAAFKRLADKGGNPPKTILCAVVAKREDAEHWLVLRHTGVNQGVGVKPWTTEQQATHRTRAGAAVDSGTVRSLTIAEELQEAYTHDADLVEVIRKVRNTKLTNIGRFFASDVMIRLHLGLRDGSGLHVRDRILTARHSADELHPFFDWALRYIDDNSVDAYKNANIRRTLLDEHQDLIPDLDEAEASMATRLADNPYGSPEAGSAGGSSVEGGDTSASGSESSTGGAGDGSGSGGAAGSGQDAGGASGGGGGTTATGTGSGSRGKNEARPEKYLFSDLRLANMERRTQDMVKEVRALEIEESPGIACVMSRVLVELVVSEPKVLAWTGARESDFLDVKIIAALKALDPKIEKSRASRPELAQAYIEATGVGIRYLHQLVHNPNTRPDVHLARRFSAAFRPLLEAIDARTAQETK